MESYEPFLAVGVAWAAGTALNATIAAHSGRNPYSVVVWSILASPVLVYLYLLACPTAARPASAEPGYMAGR